MQINGVRYGKVISIDDENGSDAISVRLFPEDNDENDTLVRATAFPLMPKMLHIKPRVGEGVLILYSTWTDGNSQRYYIGPVISQPHKMYFDPWFMGGDSYQRGAPKAMDPNPYNDENAEGAFPEDDDVSLIGRKNCDIQIKEDDIRLRAGVKLVDDKSYYKIRFNRKDPAFIKLKYHETPLAENVASTATIVADKINLFSNSSTEFPIEENSDGEHGLSKKELITDEKLAKALEDAYSLPYGEKLVELLKTMIDVFCKHTHDYISLPPNAAFITEIETAAKEPLEDRKLLSNTVKFN